MWIAAVNHSGYSLEPSFIKLARHQEIAPWSLRERGEVRRFPVEDLSREEVFHRTKGQRNPAGNSYVEVSTHIDWCPSDIYDEIDEMVIVISDVQ